MSDPLDILGANPKRPNHEDMRKLSAILLEHDAPTTDVTTAATFDFNAHLATVIEPSVLSYVAMARADTYADVLEVQLDPVTRMLIASAWIDAFMVGAKWQQRKDNSDG